MKLRDIEHKVFLGNKCMSFLYQLDDITFMFKRKKSDDTSWNLQLVIPRKECIDSQVYNIDFKVSEGKKSDLIYICSLGLRYFREYLADEIYRKESLKIKVDLLVSEVNNEKVR